MTEELTKRPTSRSTPRKRKSSARVSPPPGQRNWQDIIIRVAMLGVSAGSVAQMLGYHDLGHALMAVGGACGANAHVSGNK